MTPRRVLHCHSTFAAGGKELRSARVMNHLGSAAHHVILSAVPDAFEAASALHPDIAVEFPRNAPALAGRPGVSRYRKLAAYMRGFDLVLTYNWGAMDMVAARRLFPTNCPPLIHHEDGFNADEAARLFWRRTLFRRFALPAAQAILVPSQTLEQIALSTWHQPRERVHRIANGIATRAYAVPPRADALPGFIRQPGEVVIGTVAALREVKNIPRLVEAVGQMPPHVRLIIVGDGPDRARIAARVAQLELSDRVILTGYVPDPHHFIGLFDVFALTSDSEQAPIAVVEAMAAGLPVVAPDVGDIRFMVGPENAPFIVPSGQPQMLVKMLARLADDPALRRRLGSANQERARRDFDDAEMFFQYTQIYGFDHAKTGCG